MFSDAGLRPLQVRHLAAVGPIVHNSHDRANNFIAVDFLQSKTAIIVVGCKTR